MPPPPAGVAPVGGGVWTEHVAPDGRRKYWHNAVTRQSTYEKPLELMTPTERADATTRWKEASAADGRAYYHHLDTKETRWTLPDELRVAREAALAAEGAAAAKAAVAKAAAKSASKSASKSTSKSTSLPSPVAYATKADAELAFRAALADADVSATATWQDASRAIANDPRRDALKTAGEKRRCLHEYQARRGKEDRAARRVAEKAARDAFSEMLRERAENGAFDGIRTDDEWTTSRTHPRLRDVEDGIRTDARFVAIRDAATREDLFRAFLEDDARRRRDARRENRRDAANAYRELLLERGVDANARWREISAICADDPRSMKCDAEDRLETFASVVGRLRDAEDEVASSARVSRRRVERINREAFVALLDAKRRDGSMALRLPWCVFVETQLADEPAYEHAARNASGSRPRELYEDAQEEMERDAEADRHAVEAAAREFGVVIDQHTDAKALRAALDAASPDGVFGDDRLPKRIERIDATCDGVKKEKVVVEKVVAGRRIDRIDVACGDAVATAKTAARRAARRKRRALEDFERLLDASRRASRSKTTWEDAERRLRDAPEWRRCCGDGGERGEYLEDAKALFAARAVRLAAREAEARAAMEEGEALPDEDEDDGAGLGSEGERRRRRRREDGPSPSRSRSRSEDDDDDGERRRRRKRTRRSRSR